MRNTVSYNMTITEINELKILDSFHYIKTNKQFAEQFPAIPIFTSNQEIPNLNEIKLNQSRITKIINKFIKKK